MELEVSVPCRSVFEPLLSSTAPRFSVVVAHRRAGKTVASIQRLVQAALTIDKPNGRFGYIAPLRVQAKTIAWDYLKRFARQVPKTTVNEAELRIDFPNSSRIQLYGADNPDSIRGAYFDGVVMDEFAQMAPITWTEVVRPMLVDRKGFCNFIGTPQGKNGFFDLWERAEKLPDWKRFMFPASETGILDAEELAQAGAEMDDAAYAQEFECSFTAAIKGAFWGSILEETERQGHMAPIDYDPATPCVTAWDLGVRDSTAIWVLMPYRDNAWAAIDYYESTGQGVDHYADWIHSRPYKYSMHIAPHDIQSTDWSAAGGLSRKQIASQHGIDFERVPRVANGKELMDAIQAVRMVLPRMYFHHDNTERGNRVYRGRLALSLYRQQYNDKLGALTATPLHDWTSHAADAMRAFVSIPDSRKRLGRSATKVVPSDYRINLGTHKRGSTNTLGYDRG